MPKQNDIATATHPRMRHKHLLVYASIFVAVPVLTFIIGRVLDDIFILPSFPPFPINLILGSAVFFPGLAIGIKATRTLFKKGQGLPWGELNGQSQTKTLVTDGIYAHTRNPMVLGYSLLPCGMGIMFRSISMTLLIPTITLVTSAWVAKTREEPSLEQRFGTAYSEYKKKTPFLIPRLKPLFVDLTQLIPATTREMSIDELARVRSLQVAFYVISLLSLSVLAALTLTTQQGSVQVQKELVGAAFGTICLLGIVAGIFPFHCNRFLGHVPTKETASSEHESTIQEKPSPSFKGHHPDCGSFFSHVIQIGGRIYCAGCTGLVIGAIIALVGTIFYVLIQSQSVQLVSVMFWTGLAGVTLGLLQYSLFVNKAVLHLLLNVVFVVGAFFLLVGVNEINGSVSIGIYFLLVVLFLINVRSTLSRLEHKKKCINCSVKDCSIK